MIMNARFLLAAAVAAALTGCVVAVAPPVTPAGGQQSVANPIIQAIAPNPTSIAARGATITFTVLAHSPSGAPLDYTWSATQGQLSATKGQMVSWAPLNQDGSLKPGTATVQVIVTDGAGGVAQAAVNLTIAADGSAEAEVPPATPAPTAAPSQLPAVTPTPTPVPTAAPAGAALTLDGYTFRRYRPEADQDYHDNGDRVIQRGETVILDPKIKNTGTAKTDEVIASLDLDDPYMTVRFAPTSKDGRLARGVYYSAIAPNQSKAPDDQVTPGNYVLLEEEGLILAVSKDCPNGHVARGTLHMEDRYGNTWQSPFELTIP